MNFFHFIAMQDIVLVAQDLVLEMLLGQNEQLLGHFGLA